MAIRKDTLKQIGRTPEARVRWGIEFTRVELRRLSTRDQVRAWDMLFRWQGAIGAGQPAHDGVLGDALRAQQALRDALEAFAAGLPQVLDIETSLALFPPPPRRPGARHSGLIRQEVGQQVGGRLKPELIVLALASALNDAGADRLRRCPHEGCNVIFLATRRQMFCTRPHALAAAWKRYYAPRRKR